MHSNVINDNLLHTVVLLTTSTIDASIVSQPAYASFHWESWELDRAQCGYSVNYPFQLLFSSAFILRESEDYFRLNPLFHLLF